MKYILDTGFFVGSRIYYPTVFPGFWEKMKEASGNGTLSSVKEVQRELERYGGHQVHLLEWIKSHRDVFTEPSHEEQDNVREILAVPEFQRLISEKSKAKGSPVADPFVIARAWGIGGTVVTTEVAGGGKGKGIKIPSVCEHFGVPCVNPEEFMKREGWRF